MWVNLGAADGVKLGMVGVTAEGTLVGKVTGVGEYMSRLRLPIDEDNVVQVRLGGVTGKVRGMGGSMWLDGVEAVETVKPGDSVMTAGDADFPRDILG